MPEHFQVLRAKKETSIRSLFFSIFLVCELLMVTCLVECARSHGGKIDVAGCEVVGKMLPLSNVGELQRNGYKPVAENAFFTLADIDVPVVGAVLFVALHG